MSVSHGTCCDFDIREPQEHTAGAFTIDRAAVEVGKDVARFVDHIFRLIERQARRRRRA